VSLAEFAGPDRLETAAHATLIGSSLQSVLQNRRLLLGSGLGIFQEELRPIVVVARERVKHREGWYALTELEDAWGTVVTALGAEPEWLRWTGAVVIPSPEPHVGAGQPISSPNIGTVGCQVSWNGGSGFLTAGHVAPTANAGVYDGRTRLGTVRFANNPAGGGTAPQADVAVVELPTGASYTPALGRATAAVPNTPITVLSSSGAKGVIRGLCSWFSWPSIRGTYGDTYLTGTPVSTGGDSGSAVVDGSNGVVGLIVGGAAGMTSFIQDVGYQIRQVAALGAGLPGLTV
jgi:hypothetical protein